MEANTPPPPTPTYKRVYYLHLERWGYSPLGYYTHAKDTEHKPHQPTTTIIFMSIGGDIDYLAIIGIVLIC